jgi:hypothetical protein
MDENYLILFILNKEKNLYLDTIYLIIICESFYWNQTNILSKISFIYMLKS